MDSAHGTRDTAKKGLGNRSTSLGAALKERRIERSPAVAPEIEYELGNGDISGSESETDNVSEQVPSVRRVAMVYDEHGNATPMPMARFYYDNVQTEESEDEESEDEEQVRGDSNRQDTVRSNVPAKFSGRGDKFSDSSSSNEDASDRKPRQSKHVPTEEATLVEDAEDHEYEDELEDGESDPFKNQFMRIQIPAAQLKDVSRVKRDVDHDKPNKRRSLRVGLQRAVSTVRIADSGRSRAAASSAPPTSRQASGSRSSAGNLVRAMSFTKDKKVEPQVVADEVENTSVPQPTHGLERRRESAAPKPVNRAGIRAVGRMISMNKPQGLSKSTVTTSASSVQKEVFNSDRSTDRTTTNPSMSSSLNSRTTAARPGVKGSLSQVGRLLSVNRKKNPPVPDSQTILAGRLGGGPNQSEVESVVSDRSSDRERHGDRNDKQSQNPAPARMSLSKLGRMISFRSKRQTSQQHTDHSGEKSMPKELPKKSHLSPISSSTVSSNPVDSTSSDMDRQGRDGERSRPLATPVTNVRKESSRMNLKAAGRLLSFSRKPPGSADIGQRGRSLLVKDDAAAQAEKAKRAQSVPAKRGEEGAVEPSAGKKLDGRANMFFYSEINSARVRMSGLLGSETHIRVPVIALAEYSGPVSRTKWYIDGFTLPHNAVRRECIDLYEILTSMARCTGAGDITRNDMDDFEGWWKETSCFFSCYFEMERTIMFPWVDAAGARDWEVQLALKKMRSMKDRLQEHLVKVDQVWTNENSNGPGDLFALVYKAINEFVPRLMNYFADQEVLLPAIVKGFYRLEDRLKMDKEMVNVFMGGAVTRKTKEEPHLNLILLIRWIGNPRQLRAWIGKNLSSNARAQYGNWYNQYQEQHFRYVKTLRNRSKDMQASSS